MKRLLDLALAMSGLVFVSPALLAAAVLIKFEDGGPVLFSQQRVGQFGQTFSMWKLRTMVPNADQLGGSLTVGRDPRITRAGRWLRCCKLDELPQLWNVVRADMSLVGPRPEVPRYVRLYSQEQRRVLDLKPGITDPASIRYCHESEILGDSRDPERLYLDEIMPEKLRMNLQYAREATLWTDMAVLACTVRRLIGASMRLPNSSSP